MTLRSEKLSLILTRSHRRYEAFGASKWLSCSNQESAELDQSPGHKSDKDLFAVDQAFRRRHLDYDHNRKEDDWMKLADLTKAATGSRQTVLTLGKGIYMAQVSFYSKSPSDVQVASDLSNDELVVFNHSRAGARILEGQVEALVDFPFNTHNENTIPEWNGEDYFVMVRSDLPYFHYRESLRTLAIDWIAAGCPNQIRHI
jgi:hypothetical protein